MNSRFAVTTHIMAYLAFAHAGNRPTNSESIAQKLGTNPVVVRRLIGSLREAGLVRTQLGAGGGASLTRCPDKISLLDIYNAIEQASEPDLFALGSIEEDVCAHRMGACIQSTLQDIFGAAEEAMKQALSGSTLADVIEQARSSMGGVCSELQTNPANPAHASVDAGRIVG